MNKCPNESCGEYGEGKFCSRCGTKLNQVSKTCSGIFEDGSKCQIQIDVTEQFCIGCQKKIKDAIKTIKDKATMTQSDQNEINMDFFESLPQEPGRSEEEIRTLTQMALEGASKVKQYVEKINSSWKNVCINIGVTGASGAGKSSFINALRGLRKGQKGYSPVGVTETTTEIRPFPHPENPNLIFWDMPGVGTQSFPKEKYMENVQFKKYDFFLILAEKRFRDDDGWLAKRAEEIGKSFFLIRTHTHVDITNDRNEDPYHHSREKALDMIRENCKKELTKANVTSAEIFLIDNHRTHDYDFETLTIRLMNSALADEIKRDALVLSFSAITTGVMEEKSNALKKRIWKIALASALTGAIPVPGLGVLVDAPLILAEFLLYRSTFGLTDANLKSLNTAYVDLGITLIKKYGVYALNILAVFTTDELLETGFKIGIPILGSIISGSLSYTCTVSTLRKLLNEIENDAVTLRKQILRDLLKGDVQDS